MPGSAARLSLRVVCGLLCSLPACGGEREERAKTDELLARALPTDGSSVLTTSSADARFRVRTGLIEATLPERADGSVRFFPAADASGRWAATGRARADAWKLVVHRRNASAVLGRLEGAAVVYAGASTGVDEAFFAIDTGIEELLLVRAPRSVPSYDLELAAGSRLRAVSASRIEVVDALGTSWMRISAEHATDRRGRELGLSLGIVGASSFTLELAAPPDTEWPAIVDPLWQSTASMAEGREKFAATLLPNGKILVSGGHSTALGKTLSSTELFDPQTGTFSAGAPMGIKRESHTATLLKSGQVLIGGGEDNGLVQAVGELYDPVSGSFPKLWAMSSGRAFHTATLLTSDKVLIAGGWNGTSALASAEIYDPATNATSVLKAPMTAARLKHAAARLASGNVLLVGGASSLSGGALDSADVFDPSSNAFVSPPPSAMTSPRSNHSATLLASGKVLVVGGASAPGSPLASSEIFDPLAGNGAFVVGPLLANARYSHTATLLPSGRVLITGGTNGPISLASTEAFDPISGAFEPAGSMTVGRDEHTAVLLPSGKLFVTGGSNGTSAELFDPATLGSDPAAFVPTAGMSSARRGSTATVLASGLVLVTGGSDQAGAPLATAELFDPASGAFASTATPMQAARAFHTATLLPSGRVLIAGGTTSGGSAEIFNPSTGQFVPTGTMLAPRYSHTASLLPTGRVLLAGGLQGLKALDSAEIFDPFANGGVGAFSAITSTMQSARAGHAAALLPTGAVLLAGGLDAANAVTNSAELFVPAGISGGAFQSTGSMTLHRWSATLTLLDSGKALIAGGQDGSLTPLASAELYDPLAGGFSPSIISMLDARAAHSATLLVSGKVLLVGGATAASAELYDPDPNAQKGAFSPTASPAFPRLGNAAARLPSGGVLIVGGSASAPATSTAEIWNDGQVPVASWRPVIAPLPAAPLIPGDVLSIAGTGLAGISEASSGRTSSSATSYPMARWLPTAGGVLSGAFAPWSDSSASYVAPASALSGPGWLFAVTNGIASEGKYLAIEPLPQGRSCRIDGECASGYCADGVCCNSGCSAPCLACSAAKKGSGSDGTCEPVSAGSDPDDDCADEGVASCDKNGDCDGAGACALYAAGIECVHGFCTADLILTHSMYCNGSGECSQVPSEDCSPYRCQQTPQPSCTSSCGTNTDCADGSFCANAECHFPQRTGPACTSDSECDAVAKDAGTGYCVDGFCCESKCLEPCQACDVKGKEGICSLVGDMDAPEQPHGGSKSCAHAGTECGGYCNGRQPACFFPTVETLCGLPSCTAGVELAQHCAGDGTCGPLQEQSCDEYACGPTACKTTCETDADCHPDFRCSPPECIPRSKACTSNLDCAKGEICHVDGNCGPLDVIPGETPAGSCSAAGRVRRDSRSGWFACAVVVLVAIARRRKWRRSAVRLPCRVGR